MNPANEPLWLTLAGVLALHDRSIALHGGSAGLRDQGLLESAMERPRNRFAYEGVVDLFQLSATYGVAIAKNHPFVDGNKRAAFLAVGLFLEKNGLRLTADQVEAALTMFGVAAGEIGINGFAAWLEQRSEPKPQPGPAGA